MSIYLLPSRLYQLLILTPEEWKISMELIDKRVSYLLNAENTDLVNEVCNLVITLSRPRTLESLCDFCSGSQIDESSRNTLSGLFKLFGRVALELNEPYSKSLSEDLISISNDLILMRNNLGSNAHPISVLSNGVFNYTNEE